MADPQPSLEPEAPPPPRTYKLVSAKFRDREYPGGILVLDLSKREMELREVTGRRKVEKVVARFRAEPIAEVSVDGAVLKVSELSVTLSSPGEAEEIAGLLRPAPTALKSKDLGRLPEAEASVKALLEEREVAIAFLSQVRSDPRGALVGARSLSATGDPTELLAAVYSDYSKRLSDSLDRTKSTLADVETQLGPALVGRLYALAYTSGAVQDALFEAKPDLTQELAALQELGVSMTDQDLRMEKLAERLMERARPSLEALVPTLPA